jgi:hypothetical protein
VLKPLLQAVYSETLVQPSKQNYFKAAGIAGTAVFNYKQQNVNSWYYESLKGLSVKDYGKGAKMLITVSERV